MKNVKILGMNIPWFGTDQKEQPQPTAASGAGRWGNSYSISFDGEKNIGEIGPVVKYHLDHMRLRHRSYDAYLTSEIARTVLDRFSMWVIDRGLKLQLNPATNVLESEGIKIDTEVFNDAVESRFSVWAASKRASYNGMDSLNSLAKKAFKNANIGGDMLVILRFKNGKMVVELIDGAHLGTPTGRQTHLPNGNKIIHGVELAPNGRHVAYHVRVKGGKNQRIAAWSKSTGLRISWLVYGSQYRMEDVRGLPIISTSLETLSKIERYKEAAVGSAEERQKIAFAIVHNQFSSGENPMDQQLAKLMGNGSGNNGAVPVDAAGKAMANIVAASTNKEVFNMPIGSKIDTLESKNEMFFKEFYETNANIICSALGIPPNVAFSVYNDSFSASRAATKDWEHTMEVKRSEFQQQFYTPILAMWLHMQILDFKIQAPGYIQAYLSKNWLVVEAYQMARFTGPMFPHVDPLKEAKAERVKLGNLAENIPLTTIERSTEILNGGDSASNIEQFGNEIRLAKKNGIEIEDPKPEPVEPAQG